MNITSSYKSEFIMDQPQHNLGLSVCQSGWQRCEGGHCYGPRVRNYYVIQYIVKGKGVYRAGNKSYTLQQGNGFLLFPGETTFYQADIDDPWEYHWVGFVGSEAERLLRLAGLGRDNLIFTYTKDKILEQHISDIYYASQKYNSREFAMLGYLYLFFAILVERTAETANYHQKYMTEAIEYIERNYKGSITVSDIAAHVGIDRSYLYRIFRHTLDVSVKEYIDTYRLTKARELLAANELSISQIAVSIGFRDGAQFSKKFKEAFSLSPTVYRKGLIQP